MEATQKHSLVMPNAPLGGGSAEVHHSGVVVIVGANGSGKSRLGAWLEHPSLLRSGAMAGLDSALDSYRIGSQRVLTLPDTAQPVHAAAARRALSAGTEAPMPGQSRLQGDPVVGQSNDFSLLVNALFAQQSERDKEYVRKGEETKGNPGVPELSALAKLQLLWQQVFPERKLIIGDDNLSASLNGMDTYGASRLSDGERVGFYLIGQALLAPVGARILIDEPELHLHPSIQGLLWDRIERARTDCTFVYITHDLAFAASRVGAAKIVLHDYTPGPVGEAHEGTWKWQPLQGLEEVPEDVALEILGSRRPTLFVEGRTGGRDHRLYSALFPDFFVIPTANCRNVMQSVAGFRNASHIHHLQVDGIIDRDDRTDEDVEKLRVRVLPVAAVENLYSLPLCVTAYVRAAGGDDAAVEDRLRDIEGRVKKLLASQRDEVIMQRALYAVHGRLRVRPKDTQFEHLDNAVKDMLERLDASGLFAASRARIDGALQVDGYTDALTIFRDKGVLAQVKASLKETEYEEQVVRLVQSDPALRNAIRFFIGFPALVDRTDVADPVEPPQDVAAITE